MGEARIGRDNGPEPGVARSSAEVSVLAVHEVARVEPSKLPPCVTVDEQEAASDEVHLTQRVALPPSERLWVEPA